MGLRPWTRCNDSNAGYTWRPSGRRSGASTPYLTGSFGLTCWRRRGGGCARTGERPGSIGRPWHRSRNTARSACSRTSTTRSEQADTTPRRSGGRASRSQMAASGHWASRRFGTVWRNRRRSSCWSRSSRRTSCPSRTAIGRSGARPRRSKSSGARSSRAGCGSPSWTSGASWTPHHTAPPVAGRASKSPWLGSGSSIRRPLRRPCRTCTACNSPRLTRCNTV